MLQWHHQAVEPPGDARSDLWFYYHLGRIIREKLAGSDRRDGPAAARPHVGLPDRGGHRRAERGGGAGRDQRLGRRRPAAELLRAAERGRVHRLRLLDLLRGVRRRGQPGRPAQAGPASRTGSPPSGAGPGRPTGGSSTTGRPPIRTGSRGARARRWSGGTTKRASGPATTSRTSRPPSHPGTGRRPGRPRLRRCRGDGPVHHAGRRQGLAVRAGRADRRAAADALRAAGFAVPQPAVPAAAQPGAAGVLPAAQPLPPGPQPAGLGGVPLRDHHLPADRAPHGGRDEPLAALPVGTAAGDVLRGVPGTRRRAGPASTWAGPRS